MALERQVAIDAARASGHLLQAELRGSRRIAIKGPSTNLDEREQRPIHDAMLAVLRETRES